MVVSDTVRQLFIITSLFFHWSTLHPSFTTGNLCILYTPLSLLRIFAPLHHWSSLQPLNLSPSSVNLCTPFSPLVASASLFHHRSTLHPSSNTGNLYTPFIPLRPLVTSAIFFHHCEHLRLSPSTGHLCIPSFHWSPLKSSLIIVQLFPPLVTFALPSTTDHPYIPIPLLVTSDLLHPSSISGKLCIPNTPLPPLVIFILLLCIPSPILPLSTSAHLLPPLVTFASPTPLYLHCSSLHSSSTIGQFCIPSPSLSSAPLCPSSSTGHLCNFGGRQFLLIGEC